MSSRSNYGTRKIKAELSREGIVTSRRYKSRIMKLEGVVFRYFSTIQADKEHMQ